MRKQLRTVLLSIPGAAIALGTFVCIWEEPRDWIADSFVVLWHAMSNPFVTVLVTLLVVAYAGTLIWTFAEPRRPGAVDLQAADAARERDRHRRQLIADGRRIISAFNQQARARTLLGYLKYQQEWPAIRAQLPEEFLRRFENGRIAVVADGVKDGRVYELMDVLARLEAEWRLA